NRIRHWFSKERRDEIIERGKDLLTKEARKHKLPLQQMLSTDTLTRVADELNYEDVQGLYAGLGEGIISLPNVLRRLEKILVPDEQNEAAPDIVVIPTLPQPSRYSDSGIIFLCAVDVMSQLARRCSPVPPYHIIGFVSRGSGISLFRNDCPNVVNTHEPDR